MPAIPRPSARASLPREFFDREPVTVARELVGKLLVRRTSEGMTGGRIVEVEAYLGPADPASHSYRGQTPRNASMFGPPGHAYVYSIHARYCCNVVTQGPGTPTAILLRAIEPLWGLELMRKRRSVERDLDLTRGPARLCEALGIDRRLDGHDLTRGRGVWIADDPTSAQPPRRIVRSPRIGVTSAKDLPLRLFVQHNPYVSGPKYLHTLEDPRTDE